ncbi:MAG TPA: hypothetical protein VMU89_14025, partial [Thermomicrobiaceae bacterium]|nr:hypothetical protein [Thermomicrobiaceae bacterium]
MKDATPGHLAKDAQLAGKAALAVTAAAIPVVGGSISAAIGVWETEALTRRFERFVERVEAKVAELGAGKLDADYVGTEAFEDAVLVALDGARRTSNAEKLEWIVGLLVGSALVDPPAQLDIESVLQAIGDLSPIELRAGRRIFLDGRKQSKLFPR